MGQARGRPPSGRDVDPAESGVVTAVDVRAVGIAVVDLGGGRAKETDRVDHGVGFTEVAAVGEAVGPGERPLAVVHAHGDDAAERAATALRSAYTLGTGSVGSALPIIESLR